MRHAQDKENSLTTFFSAAEVEESGELGLPSTVPILSCVGSVVVAVVVASVVVSRLDRSSGAVVEKSRVKLYAVVVDGAIVDEVALVDEVVLLDSDTTSSAARVDCIWVMDS